MALTDNLISWWNLDEASGNALDSHSTNDLTDTNTVGSASGKVNGGRLFSSAATEYFTKADNAALSTGDIDFTWAFWFKTSTIGALQGIACKHNGWANTVDYACYINSSTLKFLVGNGSTFGEAASATLSQDTWYFGVCWHDATANTLNVSIDNGTPASVSYSGGGIDSAGAFFLGNLSGFGTMDGMIDSVGFWKRTLTSGERTTLYNSGSGVAYADISGGGGGDTNARLIGGDLLQPLGFGRLVC
jgi:hypothetical protein